MSKKAKVKQDWNDIVFPKSVLKKGKVDVKTVKKAAVIPKKSGTASSASSMLKGFIPPKPTQKRALTRADYQSKLTPQGKSEWEAIKGTIIDRRATSMVPVTKYVKKEVDVPKGYEIVEGEDDRTSKVQKAPGHSIPDSLKGPSGSVEDTKGIVTQKETTMVDSGLPGWTDAYTGERILDSGKIHIDHTVSIDRAIRSGKFKKLKDAQGFGSFLKNLVITKGSVNIKKGAKDLGEFEPTHEPKKYAKRYGSVMSDLGLVMTHGEGRAYKRITGDEAPSPVQHILDMQRGEPIAATQERHDMWMMKGKNRNK